MSRSIAGRSLALGREFGIAVGGDKQSSRWKRVFGGPVAEFVAQALSAQIQAMQAWLTIRRRGHRLTPAALLASTRRMPNVQSPMGGLEEVEISNGATVRVQTDGALTVIVDGGGASTQRVVLPYPNAGYGGHELLLSKDETYLVLWLYSGQSEVGYELFEFRPVLAHIGSLPYVYGEGFGPTFSNDERVLAMASATNACLDIEDRDALEDDVTTAPCTVEWVALYVRTLPDGAAQTCRVDVRLPAGFPFEGDDSHYAEALVVTTSAVSFRTDWGVQVQIPLPLPEVFFIEGPVAR